MKQPVGNDDSDHGSMTTISGSLCKLQKPAGSVVHSHSSVNNLDPCMRSYFSAFGMPSAFPSDERRLRYMRS